MVFTTARKLTGVNPYGLIPLKTVKPFSQTYMVEGGGGGEGGGLLNPLRPKRLFNMPWPFGFKFGMIVI